MRETKIYCDECAKEIDEDDKNVLWARLTIQEKGGGWLHEYYQFCGYRCLSFWSNEKDNEGKVKQP